MSDRYRTWYLCILISKIFEKTLDIPRNAWYNKDC